MKILLILSLLVVSAMRVDSAGVISSQRDCDGIRGRVTTPEGWLIPRAKVKLLNNNTKQTTNTETDESGDYRVCLAVGTYDITATSIGFKTAKRKAVRFETSGSITIDFPLKRGKPVTDQAIAKL
jgi:hypothetical protein